MPLPPASLASDRAYTTRWDAAPNSRFFPFIREITLVVERCVSVGEVCVELDPVPDHACCDGRPSLISRSWSTRLLCGDRDRRGRRCCVHPPWFLGLWRICRPLPNADYAFPTARPFGLTERCAPWVGPDAEAGPLPPPSLASPLESDSILLLGDGDSLTVNVSV